PQAMSPEDAQLGWNWTFWRRVLRPVIEEIGSHSPLYPALTAPNASLPITIQGAAGIEFCTRAAGGDLFVIACKNGGATEEAHFKGLPAGIEGGDVLFESPRRVTCRNGVFTDWFGPFEVHVYRFRTVAVKE